jgi:hypothetical protein
MEPTAPRKKWPPEDSGQGVLCPRCGCADLRVRNTRYSMGRIVRYRECRHCGRRVTTYEVLPSMLASSEATDSPQ